MAKHDVDFSIPDRPLGRADVEFVVKRDKKIQGTLRISNGSLVWFPKGTSYGLKMGWIKFDKMMQESATRCEKR